MALYANNAGTWTVIPQTAGKVWCSNGGVWGEAKEVWCAVEHPFNIGEYTWERIWKVSDPPPAGVAVTIQQLLLFGGDMEASWTNAANTTGMNYNVQWEVNGVPAIINAGAVNAGGSPQTDILPEAELLYGDEVRARMRYTSGSETGTYGEWSDTFNYA